MKRKNYPRWGFIKDAAVISAIITSIGLIVVDDFDFDASLERCELATQLLMDEKTNQNLFTPKELKELKDIYRTMIIENCKG